ncbi:auxin-responsive protein SAUR71-like [Typha angustifolia]|uniref:auxin-responsive protein SAUR71-like n=1 Tax=Typha angustifolia TaxID=59011 RepID=UPI003C2F3892
MKKLMRRLSRVADSSECRQLRKGVEETVGGGGRRWRVPEGHVPVYVGEEMELFAVRAELLGRPPLAELLRRSAQEYGYEQRGVLRIPCSVPLFRRVLQSLSGRTAADFAVEEVLGSDGIRYS